MIYKTGSHSSTTDYDGDVIRVFLPRDGIQPLSWQLIWAYLFTHTADQDNSTL
jgi:hypothetical protein